MGNGYAENPPRPVMVGFIARKLLFCTIVIGLVARKVHLVVSV